MARPRSPATWKDAARVLHQINPKLYNSEALARIFGKNQGSVWWALHPEFRKDFDRDREKTDERRAKRRERHQRAKSHPEFKARRRAAAKRYREKKRNEMGKQKILQAAEKGCVERSAPTMAPMVGMVSRPCA